MRNPEKLLRMLTFLGGKYPVWLDAMSINQTDEDDKKAQLVVMGDIYRKAELYPSSFRQQMKKHI
jgi:hypothetical protein